MADPFCDHDHLSTFALQVLATAPEGTLSSPALELFMLVLLSFVSKLNSTSFNDMDLAD